MIFSAELRLADARRALNNPCLEILNKIGQQILSLGNYSFGTIWGEKLLFNELAGRSKIIK